MASSVSQSESAAELTGVPALSTADLIASALQPGTLAPQRAPKPFTPASKKNKRLADEHYLRHNPENFDLMSLDGSEDESSEAEIPKNRGKSSRKQRDEEDSTSAESTDYESSDEEDDGDDSDDGTGESTSKDDRPHKRRRLEKGKGKASSGKKRQSKKTSSSKKAASTKKSSKSKSSKRGRGAPGVSRRRSLAQKLRTGKSKVWPSKIEDASEADKLMFRMKAEGKDWKAIKNEWLRIDGRDNIGESTLSVRYCKMREIFLAMDGSAVSSSAHDIMYNAFAKKLCWAIRFGKGSSRPTTLSCGQSPDCWLGPCHCVCTFFPTNLYPPSELLGHSNLPSRTLSLFSLFLATMAGALAHFSEQDMGILAAKEEVDVEFAKDMWILLAEKYNKGRAKKNQLSDSAIKQRYLEMQRKKLKSKVVLTDPSIPVLSPQGKFTINPEGRYLVQGDLEKAKAQWEKNPHSIMYEKDYFNPLIQEALVRLDGKFLHKESGEAAKLKDIWIDFPDELKKPHKEQQKPHRSMTPAWDDDLHLLHSPISRANAGLPASPEAGPSRSTALRKPADTSSGINIDEDIDLNAANEEEAEGAGTDGEDLPEADFSTFDTDAGVEEDLYGENTTMNTANDEDSGVGLPDVSGDTEAYESTSSSDFDDEVSYQSPLPWSHNALLIIPASRLKPRSQRSRPRTRSP